MTKNENGTIRGFHVVVINTFRGSIEISKIFDTYKSSEEFDKFTAIKFPKDWIMAIACKDDCSKNLS